MIVCVGTTPAVQRSLTFSSLIIDEVNRASAVTETAAGKSINVARVLTLLGHDPLATGFLGGDSGAFIQSELDLEHISHNFVNVPFRTRTCTTVMDTAQQTTTELVEESQVVPDRYWRDLETVIARQLPQCQAMVLSGSLPPGAPQDFYGACCKLAQMHKIPVIIDARGEPLRAAMPYRPVMVKPNRSELAQTFGFAVDTDEHLKQAIGRLIDLGTASVLITMGAKGAVLSDGRQFWMIRAPKVEVINPIGSGDSVAAGFTAGLVRGLPLLDCAILGIACGSANAMTPTPGVVDPAEVERLRAAIQVESF